MKNIQKAWVDIIDCSNKLIKVYKKGSPEMISAIKDFSSSLEFLSETFINNRETSLQYLKDQYSSFYLQATSLISNADSVSVMVNSNEGINDYLIIVNLFRNLLVTLDSLSSAYWLKQSDITSRTEKDNELIQYLVNRSNMSFFGMDNINFIEEGKKFNLTEDVYYEKYMNKEMWHEIKELEEKVLSKTDGSFEYFKELITKTDNLAEDMVVNLWGVLAVVFSYLEYLNKLIEG